jgi:hypothetical protein
MCEFQYNYLLDDGTAVWSTGVVRMRECSGDLGEEYVVSDMCFRGHEYGRTCHECTRTRQRPMYHKKDIHDGKPTVCPYGGSSKGYNRSRLPALPASKLMPAPRPRAPRGKPTAMPTATKKKQKKKHDKPTNKKKKKDKKTKKKDKAQKRDAEEDSSEEAGIPSAASGKRMSEFSQIWETSRARGRDVRPANSCSDAVDTDDDAVASTINKDSENDAAVTAADKVLDADSEDNSAPTSTADDDLDATTTAADDEDDSATAATAATTDNDTDADLEDDDDDDDDAGEVVPTEVEAILGNCWEFNDGEPPLCLFQFRWKGYSAKYDTFQPEDAVPADMLGPFKASRRWESLEAFRRRTAKKRKQQTNTGRKRGRPVAPIQEQAPDITPNAYELARTARVAGNNAKLAELLSANPARIEMAQQQPPRSYHKRNAAQGAPSSMNLRKSEAPKGNRL